MINQIRSLELDSLKRGIWVHFEEGKIERAKRLGRLVSGALSFFEDSLGIDRNIRVALLDSVSWTKVRSSPYGIPGVRGKNPPVAIMPADAKGRAYRMYKSMNKNLSNELRQRAWATGYSWEKIAQTKVELIVLHELGHLYHNAYGIGSPCRWFTEFAAGYFAFLYMHYKRPKLAEIWDIIARSVLDSYKPEYRTLEELERLGGARKLGGANYAWYQAAFEAKANDLVKQNGFSLLRSIKEVFPKNNEKISPKEVVAKMETEYPGFQEWATTFERQANQAH